MYRNFFWNDLVGLFLKVKVFDLLEDVVVLYYCVKRDNFNLFIYIFILELDFVFVYEVDNFIYFFFREVVIEYINCGKVNFC